jgi:hypothetical protein
MFIISAYLRKNNLNLLKVELGCRNQYLVRETDVRNRTQMLAVALQHGEVHH